MEEEKKRLWGKRGERGARKSARYQMRRYSGGRYNRSRKRKRGTIITVLESAPLSGCEGCGNRRPWRERKLASGYLIIWNRSSE